MRRVVEAGIHVESRLPTPQIGSVMVVQADVVHILGVRQDAKEFHRVSAPAGDVARQLFHHQDRAFTAAEGNGVGHFGTRAGHGGGDSIDRLIADQISDIRDDPGSAGLDELIVVELAEIFGDDGQLLFDQRQEGCERTARRLGGQLVQLVLLIGRQRRSEGLQGIAAVPTPPE